MKVAELNAKELELKVPVDASWHADYSDTAYISVSGLSPELNEADLLIAFSQYGNPVHIHLVRHKQTGKSKGTAFIKYEDQRSTVLAVDNFNGTAILNRIIKVDHFRYTPGSSPITPLEVLYNDPSVGAGQPNLEGP